ncbi:MAG: hypothetical protein ACTHNG_13305 [Ginsengibacter sp.]
MKKKTTLSLLSLLFVLFFGFQFSPLKVEAQTKDTTFKPQGKIWGLVYADYFYKSHADALNRGSYQYSKLDKDISAFQYRRVYLGYDYAISKKFSAQILLAAENDVQASTTGVSKGAAGDILVNNSFAPYIKFANIRWKDIWKGTDLVVGGTLTPTIEAASEATWAYRSVERTILDFNKTNPFDYGIKLQGKFDPATQNFGYDVMIGNGTNAVPENDKYKWFYGDLWAKLFNKKLWIDVFADYNKIGYTNNNPGYPHSRNALKMTLAYVTVPFTIGAEGFINNNKNDVEGITISGTEKDTTVLNAAARGISVYAHGIILKNKLAFFVRYDNFNPDTKYNNTKYVTYAAPKGNVYEPNTITNFITAGLDITPVKAVHFEPNIWYVGYNGQQANLSGSASHDYDLVWRMTFYFVFGSK